jgi:hypothetical protein
MITHWTDARLDKLKKLGDEPADMVAEKFYANLAAEAEPAAFFRAGRNSAYDPEVKAWLAEEPEPPKWVDFTRIERGGAFFRWCST